MPESNGDEFLYWQQDDVAGEHGFTSSLRNLCLDEAGNYAIQAAKMTDFRLRRAAHEREKAFDTLAKLISQFLPAR